MEERLMLLPIQNKRRLRVLFILPPFLPTPPKGYGGIEAVAAALIPALERAGARLTVTTPIGSQLKVSELRTITEPLYSELAGPYNVVEHKVALYASRVMNIAWNGRFDVIHDFTGLDSIASTLTSALHSFDLPPVVHTIHGPIQPFAEQYLEHIKAPNFHITGISHAQLNTAPMRVRRNARVIYNCIDPKDYTVGKGGDRFLAMGRINQDKGQDQLTRYCAEHKIPLDLAGPVAEMTDYDQIMEEVAKGRKSAYWDNPAYQTFYHMQQYIDGDLIRYHGNAGGDLKSKLLQNAKALVMANRWAEPFGMVAIEAMASGTPVLASGGGALPEIVLHGETGYLADTFDELTEYINDDALAAIDRAACREHVTANFSADSIAADFMSLYNELLIPAPSPAQVVKSSLGLGKLPKPTAPSTMDFYDHIPGSRDRSTETEI
jgi:glycosyltransferase involved in cell wall biosynthesis